MPKGNTVEPILKIDFVGEIHELTSKDTLEFGRGAELNIDNNPFLHRRVGYFEHKSGFWFLSNVGNSLHLVVVDSKTMTQATVAPGREIALTFLPATVRFRAGRSTYEFFVEGDCTASSPDLPTIEGLDTVSSSNIPFTPSQRLLIIALAEPTLRQPTAGVQIPPNKQAAARLKWPITKFNRKLDNVCAKLTKAGISNLHGTPGNLAANRRRALVEFTLQSGMVTSDDLAYLEEMIGDT